MVEPLNYGTDMKSWYRHGLMVKIWTHGIDNTNGIDLDSWYNIGNPESHTYKRAECCPNADFFFLLWILHREIWGWQEK